jgi:DNA-binding beta-propeller fold protein YncE
MNGADISGATSSSYEVSAATVAESGEKFDVVITNSAGSITSSAVTLTVDAATVAPTITTQPASTSAPDGGTATFTVVAAGTAPLSYQWQKGGAAITGATSASYTTPTLSLSDSGSTYSVTVTNSAGTIASNSVTLTVTAVAPSITTQPASTSAADGSTATFTVVASGSSPLSYQWKKGGVAISGATSASYTTPTLTVANSGSSYTVVVTNSVGSVTSNAATLTVTAVAPTITTQPANQSVNDGQTATFTVVASGGSSTLTYQWAKNGTNIAGATSASYTTPAVTIADSGSTFTVKVTDSAGSVVSNPATLTVGAVAPTITTQPSNTTAADGTKATFTVVANGGSATLTYQWAKNGTNIAGATAASYQTPAEVVADNGATFTVKVTDSAGNVTSNPAVLTVTAIAPTITTQPTSQTVAVGAKATFTVVATGGSSTLTYQWYKGGVLISGATAASYQTPATVPSDNGTSFTVTVTDSGANGSGGNVTSNAVALKVTHTLALLAGQIGGAGNVNGTGTAAEFYNPAGIAYDGTNFYVADQADETIRMITPAGVVTTLAGTPNSPGYTDSSGGTPQFNNPTGVVTDAGGNLYVTDTGNNVIRKIVIATGVVSTFVPASAGLNGPAGIAFDAAHVVLYVADENNNLIRQVSVPGGVVTTFAGTGTPGAANGAATATAQFNLPAGVAVDSTGTFVYVADYLNVSIRMITGGVVSTIAGAPGAYGSADNLTGTSATFAGPIALSIDGTNANLYVADYTNSSVRQVSLTPPYAVSTVAGSTLGLYGYNDATGSNALFINTAGTVVDGSGNVYVTDYQNNLIREIAIPSTAVSTFAGNVGGRGYHDAATQAAKFSDPHGLANDGAGNIYVADTYNNVVRKIDTGGNVTTLAGMQGSPGYNDDVNAFAQFNFPLNAAVDSLGNVYIADFNNCVIRKIAAGSVTTFAGNGVCGYVDTASGTPEIGHPTGIAVDASNDVILADFDNNVIRMITPAGVVSTIAGNTSGVAGYTNATGPAALFWGPRDVAVDPTTHNIYVTDRENCVIRQITIPGAVVSTLAGPAAPAVSCGYADNATSSAALFNYPSGLAADSSGNVYVADYRNHAIRQIAAGTGAVTTIAGAPTSFGVSSALASTPFAVALPGSLDGPSNLTVLPGSPTVLAVSEAIENSILLVTLP